MSFGALLSGHFRTHTPSKERGGVRWAPTSFLKQKVTFHECQNPKHITNPNKKKKGFDWNVRSVSAIWFQFSSTDRKLRTICKNKKDKPLFFLLIPSLLPKYRIYWCSSGDVTKYRTYWCSSGDVTKVSDILVQQWWRYQSIGHIGAAVVMLPKYRTYWCSSGDVTKVSDILVQQWWCYQSIGHIGAAVVMQACRPVI